MGHLLAVRLRPFEEAERRALRVGHDRDLAPVAIDLRRGSPTFGQHVSAVLSAQNWTQMWIPAGFAHGFCTLEPNTEVIYKVTAYYAPGCDRGLQWDDAALGIKWPVGPDNVKLSDKDRRQPVLKEIAPAFVFGA